LGLKVGEDGNTGGSVNIGDGWPRRSGNHDARFGSSGDDLDDVVFEEEDSTEVDNRWLLIVPVHMGWEFSNFWFFKNMRAAWDLAQDVKI
jgi:hypothetical protein